MYAGLCVGQCVCVCVRVLEGLSVCARGCRSVYAHQMTFVCCPPLYHPGQMCAQSYRQLALREDCHCLDLYIQPNCR